MTDPKHFMYQALVDLAQARAIQEQTKKLYADLKAQIDELVEERFGEDRENLLKALDASDSSVARADSNVRDMAARYYGETADKHPCPAVTIKEFIVLSYVEAQAIEFCRLSAPKALILDKRAFEKIAKVGKEAGGPFDLDFVVIETEPRVAVASDLSAYLTEGETDD